MRPSTWFGTILSAFVVLATPAWGDDDLDTLIFTLNHGGKEARLGAFRQLQDMGRRGKRAVQHILPFLRDKDSELREAAANALAETDAGPEAIPALLDAMKDEETGWAATRAMIGVGAAAIPALTRALRDSDAGLRREAVYALGELGPEAKDTVPALIELFAKESLEDRIVVADAWANMGLNARAAVPVLIDSLRDSSADLRLAAANALWSIERRPERLVPTLIAILETRQRGGRAADREASKDDSPTREPAARAVELLGRIGPEAHRAVPALLDAVKTADADLCAYALETLSKMGPDARKAIPAMVERLADHRAAGPQGGTAGQPWDVSISAWIGLGKMGPDAAIHLIPALKHRDKDVRQAAALALKGLGSHAFPAADALSASLRDENEDVRRYAADALGSIGPAAQAALPALLKATRDPSDGVRAYAVDVLPLVGAQSPDVVPTLIRALQDPEGTVKARAVMALGRLGAAARPAVPLLARLLRSEEDYCTRGHPAMLEPLSDCVAAVLGDLGPIAKEAVPALVLAADGMNHRNWEAVPALERIGPAAESAIPFLLNLATPEAMVAIARIAPDNPAVLPILRRVWLSPDDLQINPSVYPDRSWCYVLGRFGARAKPALPALEKLLTTNNTRCRLGAALTILEIDGTHQQALDACVAAIRQRSQDFPERGPVRNGDFLEGEQERRLDRLMPSLGRRASALVPVLCETLRNPGRDARISAAQRLAAVGPEAEAAVPALIQALGQRSRFCSPEEDLPGKAAEALARIGTVAVPSLIQALKSEDFLIRAGAADALGRIGPPAGSALAALTEALADERMLVRASAAQALKGLGQTAAPAVPSLTRALRDEHCLVRRNAAEAIGALGRVSQPATEAIVAATYDDSLFVRQAAQTTLRKIKGQ